MRKLHKAAVMLAALGTLGALGAGTAHARMGGHGGSQSGISEGNQCRSHDLNVDVLGEVGIANGLLGDALGGEGSPGAQSTTMGSDMGCNDSFGSGKSGHDEK
ncbi:hypothetical protein ABT168_01100 [Streptomyces sp. NPDC001793]|uniref:hypothetical protein n=1 Tax=Streptomyces sp. NPDC001793 TaxID=3154657 RepID=UPI00332AD0F5